MKNKIILKMTASVLLCSMLSYAMPIFAYTKDETVYSKLDANGTNYQTIVSTHLKNEKQLKLMNDLSDLTNIKNVNGDETFTQNGESLVWNANGNDIYYQGESQKELPIECHVKYELDGKEITARDLAGKSGKVKMILTYTNKEERTVKINGKSIRMYVPFVVVAGTMFENETARNVTVSSGKVIDDGTKTIVFGMAMPGLQKSLGLSSKDVEIPSHIEIEMDATDFESTNIISYVTPKVLEKEDLAIFDKLDDVYDKVGTLKSSSQKIETGAKALSDGTNQLSKGTKELTKGTKTAYDGAKEISSKVNQSIKSLSSDKGNALDEKTLKEIESQAANSSVLTDKQKSQIKSQADRGIEAQAKVIKSQAVESAKQIAEATALQTALSVAQMTAKQTAIDTAKTLNPSLDEATLKQIGENAASKVTLTNEQKAQIKAQADSGINAQKGTIEAQAIASAKQIAESTAIVSAQAGATTAAKVTAKTVANTVANEVKKVATSEVTSNMKTLSDGLSQLSNGLSSLNSGAKSLENGATDLKNGANTLSKGIQTFHQDGIEKICHYIDRDVKDLTTRVQKLTDLSKDYTHFTMLDKNHSGEVEFILMIDAIKKENDNKQEAILTDNTNYHDNNKKEED